MKNNTTLFVLIFFSTLIVNTSVYTQSLFLESAEQAVSLELIGKGIRPGIYYERAVLTGSIENFTCAAGVSSFFMKPGDSRLDLSFPTWTFSAIKYKSIGDISWTYLEFGLSVYNTTNGTAKMPAWAAGYCLSPFDNNLFFKLGLTSVSLLPNFHLQVGWRFE
ncbi:MAG: hypothetical protein H6696_00015 [Deferribacteres bacterium]|nr:hypothetical protein [Deferribacteres bacterium]